MFTVEDEAHAELIGQFPTRAEAYALLRRLADVPWNKPPNRCPCTNSRECRRTYQIVEYDDASLPWKRLGADDVLEISREGTVWMGRYATGQGG